MPEVSNSELNDLRERLRALEAKAAKLRGSTNLKGAADYLGRSDEWLRRQHQMGKGPRRKRFGRRFWSYSYADLDAFREHGIDESTA
jgi:hypothetical protein